MKSTPILLCVALSTGSALAALTSGCSKHDPAAAAAGDAGATATSAGASASEAGAAAAPSADRASRAAAAARPAPSASLTRFFPSDGHGGYKRVVLTDKATFAEAKLEKDGQEVAIVAVSDSGSSPKAKARFAEAKDKLDGFPLISDGASISSLLVADRYKVKVASRTLDDAARKAILATVDLKALASAATEKPAAATADKDERH